jgi:ABC-type multidrug transport system ATPase subunit
MDTGQMLAIMGASGAGKTSLLNLLAGRLTSSKNYISSGRVLVNGKKRCVDWSARLFFSL